MKKLLFLFLALTCATFAQVKIDQADVDGLPAALNAKAPIASPNFTGTPTAPTPAAGTQTTQLATTAFVEARVLPGDTMSVTRDALFFGRAVSNSHVVWSNTEHGIIGTNDFTIAIPVLDWWHATSGNAAGLLVMSSDASGGYGGSSDSALSLEFNNAGALTLRITDPVDVTKQRRYEIAKASFYDVAVGRPGVLIIKRIAGAMSVRLNTQAITLPAEVVANTPASTWASAINSTFIRLGQVFNGGNYLGKLGVPLIYSFALSDAECDILVTQGPRALPYRHGSFKNYAPTSGTSGWATAGTGFTITTYDLAADPDGIGLPAGASTSDYCVKVVRSGGSGASSVYAINTFRQGGPVWRNSANVKVTSLPAGTLSFGVSGGGDGAPIGSNAQLNAPQLNVGVTVAEGWKACAPADFNYAGSATGGGGLAVTGSAAATDYVYYLHRPISRPVGLLFDGIVQPGPTVRDAGPNRMPGVLVNRVDPITQNNRGAIRAQLSWSGTHEPKALVADQALIPVNAYVESIIVTPTANTSGTGLVVSDGDTTARWVTSTTLTSGANTTYYLTLANRIPQSNAANDLKFYIDPDSANYTGTINVTINYVLTY
jgi:hypothetical protein